MIDESAGEGFDQYGNPVDGSSLKNCCFPDCGCDGARLCQAENGPSFGAQCLNLERGSSRQLFGISKAKGAPA